MKFREHKGGLDESMTTCVELPDRSALVAHCQYLLKHYDFTVTSEALHVKPYGHDDRIGWDTHIVTIDGYGVIGFTNESSGGTDGK